MWKKSFQMVSGGLTVTHSTTEYSKKRQNPPEERGWCVNRRQSLMPPEKKEHFATSGSSYNREGVPSTGVTSDTRGNFGHYIKFSLFCLFLKILCKYFSCFEFLTSFRLYFFQIMHYIGEKTKFWRDMNVSKWRHTLNIWQNLSWSK